MKLYTLSDPLTGEIRYVGVTRNARKRLAAHSLARENTYKARWIRGLKAAGEKPLMNVFQELPNDCWEDAEIYWIAFLRSAGCPLTNTTTGGEGVYKSDEMKARWADPLFRAQMLRRPVSRGFSGKHHTDASRAANAAAHRGRVQSQETVLQRAAALGGRPFRDQHGVVYQTVREAARQLALPRQNITAVLKGRARSAGGGRGNGKQGKGYVFVYV
jgi:hypothetical protein